jgi:hypothetical protein
LLLVEPHASAALLGINPSEHTRKVSDVPRWRTFVDVERLHEIQYVERDGRDADDRRN